MCAQQTEMHKDTTAPVLRARKPPTQNAITWLLVCCRQGRHSWGEEPGAKPGNVGREEGPPPTTQSRFLHREQFQE